MTEVLGAAALFAGGYAIYKMAKKNAERFREAMNQAKPAPAYAYAKARRPQNDYPTLVQDPITGKYRPIER
ncbi:hypothetical protein E1162_15745 [Rhodobacteraceae bacterium RKSG542]|uniref:hypothetical protein n=1 Tax=Pseudovibrio flavus TaxID=2529854 RepID=UPI0012BB8756|nr:hypothetical protein [Pseudovibrio flavus]MTI18698.1 hypothetical protein [Pseudovibrio flavus]